MARYRRRAPINNYDAENDGSWPPGTQELSRGGNSSEVVDEPFDVGLRAPWVRPLDDPLLIGEDDEPVVREAIL